MGVNSGPVAVGNMGSDRLFDYTAVGDNVNLASRLEGLNKYYGTNILISQATAEVLGNGFILREVDLVKVKGKAQAVRIYEVIGEGEPAPELARFLELYHQGLAFTGSGAGRRAWPPLPSPGTAPGRRHQPALSHPGPEAPRDPPGPDWEAVTVMEGK